MSLIVGPWPRRMLSVPCEITWVLASRRVHAIGLAYGIAGLGKAAGPLIGGLLTDTVDWRWIFWLNVPLTVASLALGAWSVEESSDETVPRRLDLTGLALITVGIGLFTLTFDRAPHWGWVSGSTAVAFAAALLAPALFVVVETGCHGHWSTCRWCVTAGSRCS